MEQTEYPNLTTLCYIEKDGAYLMLHRIKKEHDVNRGKWIGVGGKFREGESPEECLLREVYEETGLRLTRYRYRGVVTFVFHDPETDENLTEYMHLFTADRFIGELLEDCPEGDLRWVQKDEVLSLRLWEGDRVFLKKLLEDSPLFSMKLIYEGEALQSAVCQEYGGKDSAR